jgi:hypothetical protein
MLKDLLTAMGVGSNADESMLIALVSFFELWSFERFLLQEINTIQPAMKATWVTSFFVKLFIIINVSRLVGRKNDTNFKNHRCTTKMRLSEGWMGI